MYIFFQFWVYYERMVSTIEAKPPLNVDDGSI